MIDSRIEFKIHGTMFLHSKEEQITMTSTRLQKNKLIYNKRQDTITLN